MSASTYVFAIFTVAIFASFITTGVSLNCYFCDVSGSTCSNASALRNRTCGASDNDDSFNLNFEGLKAASIAWTCIKVVSISKSTFVYNEHKGCAPETIDGQSICDAAKDSQKLRGYDTDYCGTCDDSLCNAATGMKQNFWISSMIVVLSLLPVYHKFFA